MPGIEINASNAFKLNDNFRVERDDGLLFWMEHNQQEAEALAKWLKNEGKGTFVVVRIPKDTVRIARQLRPNAERHPFRDEAMRDMGVWT